MKSIPVLLLSLALAGCADMGDGYADSDDDDDGLFGAAMQGIILGATGAELPPMREDGSGPNMLDTLNAANAALARQNAEGQARLEATIAHAQARAARQRAEEARRDAERSSPENARRIAEAHARQQGGAQQSAQQPSNISTASHVALAQAETGRAQRTLEQQRIAEENARRATEQQRQAAEAERQMREAQAQAEVERRRQAEAQRIAEQKRKQEEAERPIAYKEGVVLCKQVSKKNWRCEGPLQMTYSDGDLDAPFGIGALKMACGTSHRVPRKIGMVGDYMAFGCGYGIHPHANLRDYPGNRDVQAMLGVEYIPDLGTFYCKPSVLAYCSGH